MDLTLLILVILSWLIGRSNGDPCAEYLSDRTNTSGYELGSGKYRTEKGGAVVDLPLCLIKKDFPCVGSHFASDGVTIETYEPEEKKYGEYYGGKVVSNLLETRNAATDAKKDAAFGMKLLSWTCSKWTM
jgi:hypothetical protein